MRKMKNTGIEWIGDIPESWKISRIKYVADFEPKCDFSNLSAGDTITYTPMENIKNGYYIPNTAPLGTLSTSLTAYQDNDIVMAKVTPCFENGNIAVMSGLSSGVGLGSSELFVFRAKEIQTRYLFYWLQNQAFVEQAKATMTGTGGLKRVSPQFMRDCAIHCPPGDEQSRIVDFLDAECARIDAVIERTRASIEEYKKLKQSVITQAVTKGIRPGRKMKDSGVEWIGEIPEEWEVSRHKYVMHKRKTICEHYNGEDIISLTMNGVIIRDLDAGGKMPTSFDGYQYVEPENLLLCLFDIDVTPRCVGLVKNSGITSPAYSRFVVHEGFYNAYYDFLLRSIDDAKVFVHLSKNLRSSLTETDFGALPTVVPPLLEQEQIVEYLNNIIAAIDNLVKKKHLYLTELESYKKSLIFEYVTGKKEVV